jgi:hypothetical protein
MQARLLGEAPQRSSLHSFNTYRGLEAELPHCVTDQGHLLEYETLELRVNPPNVKVGAPRRAGQLQLPATGPHWGSAPHRAGGV